MRAKIAGLIPFALMACGADAEDSDPAPPPAFHLNLRDGGALVGDAAGISAEYVERDFNRLVVGFSAQADGIYVAVQVRIPYDGTTVTQGPVPIEPSSSSQHPNASALVQVCDAPATNCREVVTGTVDALLGTGTISGTVDFGGIAPFSATFDGDTYIRCTGTSEPTDAPGVSSSPFDEALATDYCRPLRAFTSP